MNNTSIALVIRNPQALKEIKNPSFDVCVAAIIQDGMLIKYVDTSLFTRREYNYMCEKAVKSNPKAIKLIQRNRLSARGWNNLTFLAVKHNGLALRWLKEQSPELCLDAVKQNPNALPLVDKAMCDSTSAHCFSLLKKAADEAKAKEKKPSKTKSGNENTAKGCSIDLRNAEKQTEALCLKAVRQDGLQLQYVWKQTRKICIAAYKQAPEAFNLARDDELIWLNDVFTDITKNFGEIVKEIVNLQFNNMNKEAKRVPKILEVKKKQITPIQYYQNCKEALKDNYCNIKFVDRSKLSTEQYKELWIDAIKKHPKVMSFINKANLDSGLYFEICSEMLTAVEFFQLERCFTQIQSRLLSAEQYYSLAKLLLKLFSKKSPLITLEVFDEKKFSNEQYFSICRELLAKRADDLRSVQSNLLTKAQYSNLCFMAVQKHYSSIADIDKKRLEKKDWLELCKTAIKKEASSFYLIDISPGKDFKELHNFALKHGAGLKYIANQSYAQCLAVIKKNGPELCYARPEQFSVEQYFTICKTAIEKDVNSLEYIDEEAIAPRQYQELCAIAIQTFPGKISFVNHKKISPRLYFKWCRKAVDKDPLFIGDIPFSEKYFSLCLKAVRKDGKVLKHIKYLRLSPEQYKVICKAAVKQTKEAEEFVVKYCD